jgi:hypothetical protein
MPNKASLAVTFMGGISFLHQFFLHPFSNAWSLLLAFQQAI